MAIDPSQEIQDYIDTIEKQYAAAEVYINAMEHDATQIEQDETAIAGLEESLHDIGGLGYTAIDTIVAGNTECVQDLPQYDRDLIGQIETLQADEKGRSADIATQKSVLETLDPSFKSLDDTLSAFLNALSSIASGGDVEGKLLSEDSSHIQKYLTLLFSAMRDKIQSDKNQAVIQDDIGDNLSDAQLEQFAAQMIQSSSSEQNVLGQLTSTMGDDAVAFHREYDDANGDRHRFNFFDDLGASFGCGRSLEEEAEDERVMNNAQAMIGGIANALTALAPETSSIMPAFIQIDVLLKSVMRKVQAILADIDLSPKEKIGALLSVMMFALGIFNMIGQAVQNQRVYNQQQMAKANMDASQMNMADSIMNQKIQVEEAANAKLMQTVMFVTQIVLGAIMTLAAPGLGTALLMATLTVLQTTGVMDTATNKLGSAIHSQIAAEVLISVAEIAVTLGGAYLGDKMVAIAAKTAVDTATATASATARDAAEAAARQAATVGGRVDDQVAAQAAIDDFVTQSAEKAAQRTAAQIAHQPLAALFKMLLTASGRDAARNILAKAAQEAAESAVIESETFAKLAARNIAPLAEEVTAITDRIANNTAANAAGVRVETVESATRSDGAKTATRAGWATAYSLCSGDYLIQMSQAIRKALGKDDDQAFDNFLTSLEVLKQIMQMLILMTGSGMLSTAIFDGGGANAMRIANGLSMIPQGAETAAAYGAYETKESQAKATTALARNQSIADLLHAYLDQLQKDGNLERERFIRQQQQELQSDQAMAGHLQDGDIAGIQVLVAG